MLSKCNSSLLREYFCSFYMLLASHFILNKTVQVNQHVIYPFIHSSSNWRTADDMLCAIQIPDINPTDLPSHVDFSMVAGEVSRVYRACHWSSF